MIQFQAQPSKTPDAPQQFAQYAGGAAACTAVAAARLGGPAAFAGMLSRDPFGDFLVDSLRQAGVWMDYIVRTEEADTGVAFTSPDASGGMKTRVYRSASADLLFRPKHFNLRSFHQGGIFHCCSDTLTDALLAKITLIGMQHARAAGMLVSFDLNLQPAFWPRGTDPQPQIELALAAADLIKLTSQDLAFLTGPSGMEGAVLDKLWRGNAHLVVVTDAVGPCRYITRSVQAELSLLETEIVDTSTAGEAFVGGLLTQLLRQVVPRGAAALRLESYLHDPQRLEAALRFAGACRALATARNGTFAAMPSRAAIRRLLNMPEIDSADFV